MKIKYKLIFLFIIITLLALLPASFIQLDRLEKEKISTIQHQGETFSKFLAQSVTNTILANGADIQNSRVDIRELFLSLKNVKADGLIQADSILVSQKPELNGTILSSFDTEKGTLPVLNTAKENTLILIENSKNPLLREVRLHNKTGLYFEFLATGGVPGKAPICITRLTYSKDIILAPVREMRKITFIILSFTILFVCILGYIFSRFISKPIIRLASTAQEIENGNFALSTPVSSNDEIGYLSRCFNHMLKLINLKINELEETNRRLTDLDILKDEFLANISHELKTPLYGIVGIGESLLRGSAGPLHDELNQNIRTIVSSGKSLGRLVNDILDFSKMKHYDIVLDVKSIDIYDIAQCVIDIAQPFITRKLITLENNIQPGVAVVLGDESRLQQILMNLVSNGIKFTEQGKVVLSAQDIDDEIIISVTDTGIGIPRDRQNSIFEPFHQLDGSITRSYSGAGLGLAITRKLVELHGGKLMLESKPGIGSTFSFSIKKADPDRSLSMFINSQANNINAESQNIPNIVFESTEPIPAPKAVSKRNRSKILVVDDEPVNLLIVINHLKMEGYDILTAEDSEHVDEIFQRGEIPDLILLDVMLPRISGYDICRRIRQNYSHIEMPIIMLTVRQTTQDVVAGFSAGANDYLAKPVNGEELCLRVANLISMKNSVKVQTELKSIRNELDLAIELQRNILPPKFPGVQGFDLAVKYIPSSHISGDFYDYHIADKKNVGIIIADVAGHGVPAAMIASMMQMAYSFSKKTLIEPSEILREINMILCTYPHDIYLTSLCLHIDVEKKHLRYSGAGHPAAIVYRRADNTLTQHSTFGRPIGMFDDTNYITGTFDLLPGDRIILYTDGITEAKSPSRDLYGNERFESLIADGINMNASDFAQYVVTTIYDWTAITADRGLSDDITMLVIDFKG